MLLESGADVVALADVDQRAQAIVGIRADQEVDPGAAALRALDQLAELAARPGEHVAGPVHDLGGEQAVGRAVHQEEPDAASLRHTISDCVVSAVTDEPARGCQPRTSILPVTAAEIRAERRSASSFIAARA